MSLESSMSLNIPSSLLVKAAPHSIKDVYTFIIFQNKEFKIKNKEFKIKNMNVKQSNSMNYDL